MSVVTFNKSKYEGSQLRNHTKSRINYVPLYASKPLLTASKISDMLQTQSNVNFLEPQTPKFQRS